MYLVETTSSIFLNLHSFETTAVFGCKKMFGPKLGFPTSQTAKQTTIPIKILKW